MPQDCCCVAHRDQHTFGAPGRRQAARRGVPRRPGVPVQRVRCSRRTPAGENTLISCTKDPLFKSSRNSRSVMSSKLEIEVLTHTVGVKSSSETRSLPLYRVGSQNMHQNQRSLFWRSLQPTPRCRSAVIVCRRQAPGTGPWPERRWPRKGAFLCVLLAATVLDGDS